jgi:tetratricopeptide (TPR) repeat protein
LGTVLPNNESTQPIVRLEPYPPTQPDPEDNSRCRNCSNPEVEEGYHLALCKNCRNELVARPVPIWIKTITFLIVLLLIVALIRFPETVRADIYYERGLQAEKNHRFATAVHNYEKVVDRFPNSTTLLTRLFIAYYINIQIDKADETFRKIAGRKVNDHELAGEVNRLVDQMESQYFQDKELADINKTEITPVKRISQLQDYIVKYPTKIIATYQLADTLYDQKHLDEVEKLLVGLQKTASDLEPVNLLLAATYREKGKFDLAKAEIQKVLSRNNESFGAYFALSRIELKQHQDAQGLADAEIAYNLVPEDASAMANLALAYHYNQNFTERDHLLSLLKERKDYADKDLKQLDSIFKGETAWRN